jgi:hypothetical protein
MRLPMASDVGVMEHVWLRPYANGKLGERMQLLAAGSTVQRPEMMVKSGGDGGGGGGAGGEEHTRQPPEVTELSEDHVIDPVPKTKLEGPKDSPIPLKDTCAPAVLGMLRMSQPASVEKEVAVMRLPMASDVGVMEHVWLLAYANGKLGERMQFVAAGSTVQRPEVMVKN